MMDYIYHFHDILKNKIGDYTKNVVEETKTSIIFKDGGEIHSLPNSANTVRGFKADDIYIDEFAHFTNGTDKEVVEALMPSLSRGGTIRYISTPYGDKNMFYEMCHPKERNKRKPQLLINYQECPDFHPEDIQRARETLGEDGFQQEYNNQFLSDMEGQEFPLTLIQQCVDPEMEYVELDKNKVYLGGADIGREQDLTAIIVLEKTPDKILRVVYKQTMKNMPYHEQMNIFNYLLNNYNFMKFRIDESGIGNMMAEELSRGHRIECVTFTNETKQDLVGNTKRLMQDKKILFPEDPQLISSFREIRRIYTPSNYLRFDSIRDDKIGHADLFWALTLAVKDESTTRGFVKPVAYDW